MTVSVLSYVLKWQPPKSRLFISWRNISPPAHVFAMRFVFVYFLSSLVGCVVANFNLLDGDLFSNDNLFSKDDEPNMFLAGTDDSTLIDQFSDDLAFESPFSEDLAVENPFSIADTSQTCDSPSRKTRARGLSCDNPSVSIGLMGTGTGATLLTKTEVYDYWCLVNNLAFQGSLPVCSVKWVFEQYYETLESLLREDCSVLKKFVRLTC